ncbi:CUB and zona pellucida-like domain-containing protein 1 [Labrus mixtus]|uniref:CUB and zona pellucida-like domain-containing protein 1 n=1 Tax=Labrus mixtus TaxID=508554 RepID=UPI0029C0C8A0|nr:CUB and zona pellucida-like domain-containing protein 1 [Labrus mixtus]
MAFTLVLLLQLLLVSLTSASHHMGGTATYTYRGKTPDGKYIVDFHNRDTYDRCSYSHYWSCYQGQCGSKANRQHGVIDNSTNAPSNEKLWCETETVDTRYISSDKPFQLRAASCCWISARNAGASNWRLLTSVDLGTRSDTKEPNRSPDIAILPVLRVPQNCTRTYKLTTFDPDGDKVRCRYGKHKNTECGTCDQPSGFHLNPDSCTLQYNSASYNYKSYVFEMVVEDFPRGHITLRYSDGSKSSKSPALMRKKRAQFNTTAVQTTPASLSKLPLHFSFLVDKPVPSCQPGQYLPEFVSPTPENGAHIHAEVNMEVEIRVKAQSSFSKIQDIIFSGPLNTTKHRTTHNEFVITWTPTSDHLGNHYVICFAVESVSGSYVYQSDMRCVVVDVGKKQVEANVICSQSTMRVEIEKSSFPRLSEDDLRLTDPSNVLCSLKTHSNSTHVIGIIPLNSCGTQIEEDEEFLKFKNVITTFENNSNNLITRKNLLEVQFYCQYPKRGNVTQSFTSHRNVTTVWEKGFGKFTYQFEFYPNVQFQTMIDPHYYPLEYDLGSRIYMQIEATSSLNNTELFVESCSAAPYDNPNYMPVYPIIQNGCVMDSTVIIHSPDHQRQFKFSMEAFKFIGLHNQVYISCSVLMCQAGEPNTRCSQGCKTMNQGANRRKRETVSQTSSHFVSQGPLRMRRSAERAESPVMNLNLNLVFIAGCLVAAVGMISGVAVYKAKISRVKYQPLPTFED